MEIRHFLAAKKSKLPPYIADHQFLTKNKVIDKVFPKIGLLNFKMKLDDSKDIIFSSSEVNGMWDIATMSMRGVSSCMHWKNIHSKHVIGSMADPCVGIIYITDNSKTEYGKSILKRSLVRLLWDYEINKPIIGIERVYTKTENTDPYIYNDKDIDFTENIFMDALKKKLKNKYEICYLPHAVTYYYSMIIFDGIDNIPYDERTMSDRGLVYRTQSVECKKYLSDLGIIL